MSDPDSEKRPRRVLYLAFYFPPLGGGGVQRSAAFVEHLPRFGFDPVVVTGPGTGSTRHAPLDPSLRSAAPIFRVSELPDDSGSQRAARLLARPSAFGRAWSERCYEAGLRAASEAPVEVILASMSPFETCAPAARLARELRAPWVADLRDPWALDEMSVYPTRWHRALEVRRMRRALSSAARIVMNTPDAARALRDAFPELAERTLAITNGFDARDYRGAIAPRADGRFRIVHTGSLHAALGAAHRARRRLRLLTGGERVPVDILTRSHVYLLKALERWRERRPEDASHSELVLAGELSGSDLAIVAGSRVADQVRTPGYLSHAESVALLRSADLLFLPMHKLPRGERARIVPGKTYEYLAARRPILAAVPEGDARDFVLASGLGEVCAPDDVSAMAEIIEQRFGRWRSGSGEVSVADDFLEQFERRRLAEQLAGTLESALRDAGRGATHAASRS